MRTASSECSPRRAVVRDIVRDVSSASKAQSSISTDRPRPDPDHLVAVPGPMFDAAAAPIGRRSGTRRSMCWTTAYVLCRPASRASSTSRAQAARGYLERRGLTAERFVADPFRPAAAACTDGDLARWRSRRRAEFRGRRYAGEVRGFRIERRDRGRDGASRCRRQCAVVAREETQDRSDCRLRWWRGRMWSPISQSCALSEPQPARLHGASAFVLLERLPLTPNGKLDPRGAPGRPNSPPGRPSGSDVTRRRRSCARCSPEVGD